MPAPEIGSARRHRDERPGRPTLCQNRAGCLDGLWIQGRDNHPTSRRNLQAVEGGAGLLQSVGSRPVERGSFVVALGGGVVGDLAGFVAATYLRGVDFVQIPTTLLAQVDSSVGGKVGINLKAGKNLVGAFYQPKLVLCDLDTLQSLPKREFRAGMAEVIKYGIIWDAPTLQNSEAQISSLLKLDATLLEKVVARCCQIKAAVVGQDEKEGGLRAILNYGHTIGHAIEAITRYGTYLHGEAISIGQVAAGHLSQSLTGLKARCAAHRGAFQGNRSPHSNFTEYWPAQAPIRGDATRQESEPGGK